MVRAKGWRSAVLLGFALGGFFDGILLHQVLQWHHLLSLVPGVGDLRAQVLWDGLFHALMYGLAALGLWGLWRVEHQVGRMPGRAMLGALLVGFGLWHVVDSVLSHWVLGIHRIRVDAANPLAWDLLWLAGFGLVPLWTGWVLGRSGGPAGRPGAGVAALAVLALGAGGWALWPPPGQPYALAVFRCGLEPARIEESIAALGGRLVWSGPELDVVLIDLPNERRWALYARGALMIAGAGAPVGCLGWSEAQAERGPIS